MDPLPPTPQNSAPSPIAEPEKDSHWITILAMALFVLTSLAAVIFLYYQNQQLKKMLASYQSQPSPTPTPTPDVTANWKTYLNSSLFFKYPGTWQQNGSFLTSDSPQIKVFIANKNLTLMNECMQEISSQIKANASIRKFQRVTTGEMCQTSDPTSREIWVTPSASVYAPGISLQYSSTDAPYVEMIFDQIFSTFKFFDEEDKVVGIQTDLCCSCPAKISPSLIGTNGWVLYEEGKNYSEGRPAKCQGTVCAPCPPL